MMTMVVFILYLLLMLGVGFYFSKKANSLNSYYLGNRNMNKWVVAMSAQASDMSGWLLMGLPGAIYVSGLSEAWIGVGLAIGTYVNWKIVGRRLRKYTYFCNDSITLQSFPRQAGNYPRDFGSVYSGIFPVLYDFRICQLRKIVFHDFRLGIYDRFARRRCRRGFLHFLGWFFGGQLDGFCAGHFNAHCRADDSRHDLYVK